jgi:phosphocarrier protein HPr
LRLKGAKGSAAVSDDSIDKDLTVRNKMGLHARPAAQVVQTANKFRCEVTLSKDGQDVNGKSIMGVLMLAASQGTAIHVHAEGEEAQACVDAISALFEKGFNEQM